MFQRKHPSLAFCVVLIAAPFNGNLFAQHDRGQPLERNWQRGPLELTLRLSDESPLVSDEVTVQLRVKAPDGADVEMPKLEGVPKDFQISGVRGTGPASEPDGAQVWGLDFKLEMLRAGHVELPPLTVRYRPTGEADWSTAETEPVAIEFRSLLGDDPDAAQPQPNPGPLAWPGGKFFWILIASACIATLLIALGGWLVWSRRPRLAKPLMPISPYRKALEALLRIETAGYLERGEVERFYTELSGVIRHYIEDQFGLRAPEQTTEEFLQELTQCPVLVATQRRALQAFLEQSDLVKFAKVRPTSSEGKAALSAARTFVESTHGNWASGDACTALDRAM